MKRLNLLYLALLLSSVAHAQNTWRIVPGAPAAIRMDDLCSINDSVAWTIAIESVYRTTDRGETWDSLCTYPGFYMRSIEFLDDQVGFLGTLDNPGGLYKTIDGGASFTRIDSLLPVPAVWGICGIGHLDNLVLAVGSAIGDKNIYKSIDAGQSWILINLDSIAKGLVDVFIVDSLTYLVSGISDSLSGSKASIFRTTDGGLTWTRVASSANMGFCWKIFIRTSGVGLASIENYSYASVFKTMDFGQTWNEIIIPWAPYKSLGGIGLLNDTLGWVGCQHGPGMYETTDGGISWTPVNFGTSIDRMIAFDSATVLAVGQTVYKYGPGPVGMSAIPSKEISHTLEVYPNPASGKIKVELDLYAGTPVVMELIDTKGMTIKKIEHAYRAKGKHSWSVDLHNLPAGNYIISVVTIQHHLGKKFQVTH